MQLSKCNFPFLDSNLNFNDILDQRFELMIFIRTQLEFTCLVTGIESPPPRNARSRGGEKGNIGLMF